MSTDQLVTEVLRLPRLERALLAEKLLESLDFDEDFTVSKEWRDEILRRAKELDEGQAELIPGDEVFDEATKRLR